MAGMAHTTGCVPLNGSPASVGMADGMHKPGERTPKEDLVMLGIREKLSLGFGALLLIIIIIGVQGIRQLTTLGHSIDVILRENYRSVIACQEMKEARVLLTADSGKGSRGQLFMLLLVKLWELVKKVATKQGRATARAEREKKAEAKERKKKEADLIDEFE